MNTSTATAEGKSHPLNVTRMTVAEMQEFSPIRPEAKFYVVDPFGLVIGPAGSADWAKAIIAKRRSIDETLEWHLAESGALQDVLAYIDAQKEERYLHRMTVNGAEVH